MYCNKVIANVFIDTSEFNVRKREVTFTPTRKEFEGYLEGQKEKYEIEIENCLQELSR